MITIILLLVIFLDFLLGFLSITQDRKSWINKFFSLLCFFSAIWTFTNLMTGIYPTSFWLKSTYSFGALVMSTGLVWTFVLTDKTLEIKKIIIIYIFAFFFFVSSFFDGFIAKNYEAIYPGGAFTGDPGIGLIPYSIFFSLIAVTIIYKLIFRHRKAVNKDEKIQLRYILYGALGTLIISLLTSFIFPIFEIYQFSGLDSIGFLIFLLTISYAVIKYRLLDVRVIATELLTFAIWIFLLVKVILSKNLTDFLINGGLFIAVIFFGILLIRSVIKVVEQREKLEVLSEKVKKAFEVEKKAHEQINAAYQKERAALETEKKAHKELKRLDDAKNQFMMATQHHLRTPLTSMSGYMDLLFSGSYGKIPPKIKKSLKRFQVSTKRLMNIVEEFLDISQFQLGKKVVKPKPNIRIRDILEEVIEELRYAAEAQKVYLKLKKPKKEAPPAMIDPEKLKAALSNIIDNGIKYTRKGGVTLSYKPIDGKIQITIKDTGVGMTKEERESAFGKTFERGEEAKKLYTTGRGIGLFIASQIIKAHQGTIRVESEGKGKGTAFYIELPIFCENGKKSLAPAVKTFRKYKPR